MENGILRARRYVASHVGSGHLPIAYVDVVEVEVNRNVRGRWCPLPTCDATYLRACRIPFSIHVLFHYYQLLNEPTHA